MEKIMSSKEYDDLLAFTIDLATKAGESLLTYHNQVADLDLIDKGAEGIASRADEESEELIIDLIKQRYPSHEILAEEEFSKSKKQLFEYEKLEWCWVIDPLDGTNNFINGISFYAVSIALLHQGSPVVGVVYNPLTTEMFWGSRGEGSFHRYIVNQKEVTTQLSSLHRKKDLSHLIVSPALDFNSQHPHHAALKLLRAKSMQTRAIRRFGAAAMELCYVARGFLDAYWEAGLRPWDIAAAQIICEEANVCLKTFTHEKADSFSPTIIAANPDVHTLLK